MIIIIKDLTFWIIKPIERDLACKQGTINVAVNKCIRDKDLTSHDTSTDKFLITMRPIAAYLALVFQISTNSIIPLRTVTVKRHETCLSNSVLISSVF